jgi:hypothetical protein
MRRIACTSVLLAALAAAPAPAAGDDHEPTRAPARVIGVTGAEGDRDVTRLGPWVVRTQRQSTLARARRAFGRPTRCTSRAPGLAAASWRAAGLRAVFYTLDIPPAGPACRAPGRIFAGSVTLTGPSWRTQSGLRVGDRLARVEELYPQADSVRRLYPGVRFPPGRWQLEARTFAGDRSPLLMAVMRSGKVVAFEVALGRGGE